MIAQAIGRVGPMKPGRTARFDEWAGKLKQVAESAEWKEAMVANGLAPFTKVGGDFQSWIDNVIAETVELSKEIGVIQ